MIKVGITGGIGSGKTTVCKLFEDLGVPVYYSDLKAKQIMTENQNVKNKIIDKFGAKSYDNNKLNTHYLSAIVFSDDIMLNKLNAIVHPAVFDDAEKWFKAHNEYPYLIFESALLLENGKPKLVDKVILVIADIETRIQRVMQRDQSNRNAVLNRILAQQDQDKVVPLADFIINNNRNEIDILSRVLFIHNQLIE